MVKGHKNGIILVLSGGGAKGLAHIGVLEVLEENKIPIKRIVGTSAGALIGGLYCAGKLEETKNFFLNLKKWDIYKALFSIPSLDYIFNSRFIEKKLKEFTGDVKIEDLKIPFTAVAFNLSKRQRILIESGKLFDAIRSSISLPGYFKPFKLGESMLIDGGVIDVLPVRVAKKYGIGEIIAVNVISPPSYELKNYNIFNILNYANYFQTQELANFEESGASFVIKPTVNAGLFEFDKAKELIKEGRKATQKSIQEIKRLIKGNKERKREMKIKENFVEDIDTQESK